MMDIMAAATKLQALRKSFDSNLIDVYLIPPDDPHLSEYTPDAYKRRAFLTNFHGSAGTAVVSHGDALLWTDSRYFNEATQSLDLQYWTLMKQGTSTVPSLTTWLAEQAYTHFQETGNPIRIGIDPYVFAASFATELKAAFASQQSDQDDVCIGELVTLNHNLIDPIWASERPAIPTSPFRVHPMCYAGMTVQAKVAEIRNQMMNNGATLAVFCTLDDVAYLFNMRAQGDVETCPVGLAYATVSTDDEIILYCDSRKLESPKVKEHLKKNGVTTKPYDAIVNDISSYVMEEQQSTSRTKVWIDSSRANLALVSVIPTKQLVDSQNAISSLKACKNTAELEGMRQAHLVDGAAMAEFMAWLTSTIEERTVSEVEIDLVLTAFRAKQPGFLEVSFPTIAGVGSNGAIIHYRASNNDLLKYLDKTQPILIDSGGQYLYGTTDVTRTWYFGDNDKPPNAEFINSYTRVLKGNIGVDAMIFPENTPGFVLDVIARKSLWDVGKDYGHGTGHGVGAALNVHEGPFGISARWSNQEVLKATMIVSNEPGYYEDGNFGVRIENLLEIIPVKQTQQGSKKFLRFEKLTMIPIQKNLIDLSLMTADELDWLDAYHQQVLDKVGPLLLEDSPAKKWLLKSCEPIDRSPLP